MRTKKRFQCDGLTVEQVHGPAVEVFFEWDQLPEIDLSKAYYIVKVDSPFDNIPIEYVRPNSAGPLFLFLRENVPYTLSLIAVPYFRYTVRTDLVPKPYFELIQQHENLNKLVWGKFEHEKLTVQSQFSILVDGKAINGLSCDIPGECSIVGRPTTVALKLDDHTDLATITTNYDQGDVKTCLNFVLEREPVTLFLSTSVKPAMSSWRVLAEIPFFFNMREYWMDCFHQYRPESDPDRIVGVFRFSDDNEIFGEYRQFGYMTRIHQDAVNRIQIEEWKGKSVPPTHFKLELQITSAHRELFKYVVAEKQYKNDGRLDTIGFTSTEIDQAKAAVFKSNRHVRWDQSFIELVLFFKTESHEWQEFQRDIAQSDKWEFQPSDKTRTCRCEWLLYELDHPDQKVTILTSGVEQRPVSLNQVFLRPYSANQLFACWDLDENAVIQTIHDTWQVESSNVGFYLKIHEEYLGSRIYRRDLDSLILDLFSAHQNIYFNVDPNKCFSAEIVARHFENEISLTPVSRSIVTPREIKNYSPSSGNPYRQVSSSWYHPAQREVGHRNGKDANNEAKVLLHLHMHSPNLFRIEPFRDTYLRDTVWPIKLESGAEVFNPPGEWAYKNCLDSWLPILRVLRKLAAEGIDYQLSLDITPPVAYMLNSPRFKDYLSRYLLRMRQYTQGQLAVMKSRGDSPDYIWAAERYLADLDAIDLFYNHELGKDIIEAFRQLESQGFIEIITCTATHGMPAELESIPDALQAQLALAARSHRRLFGDRPRGIWLAENSYFPGVESYLEKEDSLNYFFAESEAILYGSYCPREEEFNPIIIPGSQVVAFGRSRLGRTQVWDAKLGYAGHPDFREYHFRHMGLPIKRITSKQSDDKQPYHPDRAHETACHLAYDFHHKLSELAYSLNGQDFKSIPLISCSYDAELFGHHWSEGPIFLEALLKEFYYKSDVVGLTTGSHYLAGHPTLPEQTPNPSTWGHDSVHVRWTDPKVAWTFIEFEKADKILRDYLGFALQGTLSDFQKEMVEQMGAEFIRAQSSDLTFVIMSGDFEEDMFREILKYLNHFYRLKNLIDNRIEDTRWLNFRKYENDMFPEIPDYYQIR